MSPLRRNLLLALAVVLVASASLAVAWRTGRTVPLEVLAALPAVPALAWLLDRSLVRALAMTAAVALAMLGAAAAGASVVPAAGAAWIVADRIGRESGATRVAITFGAACAITAAAFAELRFEISIPILIGAFAGVLLGALGHRAAGEHRSSWARWSPAIFWCLASGIFCLLIVRGAVAESFEIWAAGLALALLASWVAPVSRLFTLSSALLIAWTLAGEAAAFGLIAAFVWALSASAMADLRLERGQSLYAELATCFGAGYTPKGSGTVGAVTALPIGWLLAQVDPMIRAAVLLVATAASIGVAYGYMAQRTGDLDPKEVVLDEHLGVLLALAVVPWEWPWVAAAFALFRLFDIAKPWPVGWIDRKVKNPSGVMLDDIVAGLMAAALLAGARALL